MNIKHVALISTILLSILGTGCVKEVSGEAQCPVQTPVPCVQNVTPVNVSHPQNATACEPAPCNCKCDCTGEAAMAGTIGYLLGSD